MAEIRVGDTVEGINREKRHMEVIQVLNSQTAICQWYDESGKQEYPLPISELRFVADVPTEELLDARKKWVSAKTNFVKSNETLAKERSRKQGGK